MTIERTVWLRGAIVLALGAVLGAQGAWAEDWTVFHREETHTGFSPERTDRILNLLWRFPTQEAVYSSPVSWAGFVYFGAANDTLYALNGQTGLPVWKFGAKNWIETAPAVASGMVHVPSEDHTLYAVAANTGQKMWSYDTESWLESAPIVVGNSLCVGSSDHYLYSLNARTGTLNWRFRTSGEIIASPGYSNGILYAASDDDTLYALDTQGQLLWKYGATGAIYSAPCISGGFVVFGVVDNGVSTPDSQGYFQSLSNKVVALNATTGALAWEYVGEQNGFVYSSPAVAYGRVYFGTQQGFVRALDLGTGTVVWERRINDYAILGSPAVADSVLFVPSYDGKLYAISGMSGAIEGQFSTGSLIHSSPAVANGKLYFGSDDGFLYCLDISQGVSVGLAPGSTSIPRGGTLNYTVTLTNESSNPQTLQYWADLTLPNGNAYARNPVYGPSTVTLLPNQTKTLSISHRVPASAALGKYIYSGKTGTRGSAVNDQDSFIVEVTARR